MMRRSGPTPLGYATCGKETAVAPTLPLLLQPLPLQPLARLLLLHPTRLLAQPLTRLLLLHPTRLLLQPLARLAMLRLLPLLLSQLLQACSFWSILPLLRARRGRLV